MVARVMDREATIALARLMRCVCGILTTVQFAIDHSDVRELHQSFAEATNSSLHRARVQGDEPTALPTPSRGHVLRRDEDHGGAVHPDEEGQDRPEERPRSRSPRR